MKATLKLSCDGVIDNDFIICESVVNVILDLERAASTKNYSDLITYLDKVPKLFDGPCICKTNTITNTIYKIYELGYVSDAKYRAISHFINLHFKHGMILRIDISE